MAKRKENRQKIYLGAGALAVIVILALAIGGNQSNLLNPTDTGMNPTTENKANPFQSVYVPQNQTADYYLQRESQLQEKLTANEQNSATHAEIALVYTYLHKRLPTGGFNESAAYHNKRAIELRAMGK